MEWFAFFSFFNWFTIAAVTHVSRNLVRAFLLSSTVILDTLPIKVLQLLSMTENYELIP